MFKFGAGVPHERWRTQIFDPRSLLVMVIVCNVVLTIPLSQRFLAMMIAGLGIALAVFAPLKIFLGWAGFLALQCLFLFVLPAWWPSSLTVSLAFVAMWMVRFAGLFACVVAAGYTLDMHRLGANLNQLHIPRTLAIPIMVIVRFFPTAMRELRAIVEAMSLRGLRPGMWATMRHPLQFGEYVLVPFLAMAARTADELSAAAIIKGLGAEKSRTCAVESTFRWPDYLAFAASASVIFSYLIWTLP